MEYLKSSLKFLIILLYGVIHLETTNVVQLKIVNGTEALPGEFPFMVSLRRIYMKQQHMHICGGSLLNHLWVLTAGHCVLNVEPDQLSIQYDSVELSTNATRGNVAYISKIFINEGFNVYNLFIHDIALLRLIKPVHFKSHDKFAAVRLPQLHSTMDDKMSATLIGWGSNETGGTVQKYLQKVDLKILDIEHCSKLHNITLHNTTICAGVPEGYRGQCNGDSGGPLLVHDALVGIVSWSRKPCTHPPFPGVFTRVSSYLPWILKIILDYEDQYEKP